MWGQINEQNALNMGMDPQWAKLTGDIKYVYEDFLPAYKWMMNEMNKRIKDSYPIWAWYQWQDDKHKKPDLRYSGHLEKGKKAVRIELEVDENKILLSDFDNFHYVLNYWYLCKDKKSIQAVMWSINWDEVVDVKEFVSR